MSGADIINVAESNKHYQTIYQNHYQYPNRSPPPLPSLDRLTISASLDDIVEQPIINEKELLQQLFENKYECFRDKAKLKYIFDDDKLLAMSFSLILADIANGVQCDLSFYECFLTTLVSKKILSYKTWKKTKAELLGLFKHSPSFVLSLVKYKLINFSEILDAVSHIVISTSFSELCVSKINNHMTTYTEYPLYLIDIMLTYDIPLNLSVCSCDQIKHILRYFNSNSFRMNDLLANICVNNIDNKIFTVMWSKIDETIAFFISEQFCVNFFKMSTSVILAYAHYIKSNTFGDSFTEYEFFLDSVIIQNIHQKSEFAQNFLFLLTNIQNKIVNDNYHMSLYKSHYHQIFKCATTENIKTLNFSIIINFKLDQTDLFSSEEMYNMLCFCASRDGIDLMWLRDIFYKHNTENVNISNVLTAVLKNVISNEELTIELLLLLLEKLSWKDEELKLLKTKYSDYNDDNSDNVIITKLMCADPIFSTTIFKVFPEKLKKSLILNIEEFRDKTKCLATFEIETSPINQFDKLQEHLAVLNTLQKINNCDKFICGICSTQFIGSYYECGHTICTECAKRTPQKCPYCREEHTAKQMYLSS